MATSRLGGVLLLAGGWLAACPVMATGAVAIVFQGGDAGDVQVEQAGTAASAHVQQSGFGNAARVQQVGTAATAAVFQSAASIGARAILFQAAVAPIGVIEQGVPAPVGGKPAAFEAEAALVRLGAPFATMPSAQLAASVVQTGGAGLKALVMQGGTAASATVTQAGAYLEADIVQSGGAHVASIAQFGAGTAASPYRASITQAGAQPQSIAIQQVAGSSPRVVQVIQR